MSTGARAADATCGSAPGGRGPSVSKLYHALLRRLFRYSFSVWQRLGFHVTPNHFSQPIPDTRTLKDDLWLRHSELVGINMNEDFQLRLLFEFCSKFRNEYEAFPRQRASAPHQFYLHNGAFECVDAEILYCMVRYFKPKVIFEIGAGYSTLLAAEAILRNKEEDQGYTCQHVAVEPYPKDFLMDGFPGLSRLIHAKIQDIPLSEFTNLRENDVLFIDSTHVLTIGSDVQYEYLEILPRLNKGVIVHMHDIFLPAEYLKNWVFKLCKFYNEQYLLQAFLAFNDSWEVMWAASHLHLRHAEKLEACFGSYKRDEEWPGSFWMRRIR